MLSSCIFFMTLNQMKLYFHALFIEKNRSKWEQIFGANRRNFLKITQCFNNTIIIIVDFPFVSNEANCH